MAQEKIEILYDMQTGQLMVGAPMGDQDQKNRSISVLLSAIKMITDYKPSVIQPAKSISGSGVIPGNGHIPVKVSH